MKINELIISAETCAWPVSYYLISVHVTLLWPGILIANSLTPLVG